MRDTTQDRAQERVHMERLAAAMKVRARRDECGDPTIQGRTGNIHVDGAGYLVAVMLGTARQWHFAKQKLRAFCPLRQAGDSEGALYMATILTAEQAEVLREVLGVRKRREVSEAERERLAGLSRAHSPLRARPSPSVNGHLAAPDRGNEAGVHDGPLMLSGFPGSLLTPKNPNSSLR